MQVYMALPARGSLTDGHALLIPTRHATACTELDEDVWDEMDIFKQYLVQMWKAHNKGVVFMETVMNLRRNPHTVVHCIPLDGEQDEFSPMSDICSFFSLGVCLAWRGIVTCFAIQKVLQKGNIGMRTR